MDGLSVHSMILDGSAPNSVIQEALDLLEDQWPHEKSIRENRKESIVQGSKEKLPLHIVLATEGEDVGAIQTAVVRDCKSVERVLAYAKLQGAYGKDYGDAGVIYSVVVQKTLRGKGLGRMIMTELEEVGKRFGLSYLYLFTDDQVNFYKHLGYMECEPISSLGDNTKLLKPEQVEALENIFARRLNIATNKHITKQVWLRKRLGKETRVYPPCDWNEICQIVAKKLKEGEAVDKTSYCSIRRYCVFCLEVPIEQQIGPMCGITALKMAMHNLTRKTISVQSTPYVSYQLCSCCGEVNHILPSDNMNEDETLFDHALRLAITTDGELFCAYNLVYLCKSWYNVDAQVYEIGKTYEFVLKVLCALQLCQPVLIPYDRDVGGFTPALRNGNAAHWAVITGVVLNMSDTSVNIKSARSYHDDSVSVSFLSAHEIQQCELDFKKLCDHLTTEESVNGILLVCVHGMSKLPFLCEVSHLVASNKNLNECKNNFFKAPKHLEHLRGKVVFISKQLEN